MPPPPICLVVGLKMGREVPPPYLEEVVSLGVKEGNAVGLEGTTGLHWLLGSGTGVPLMHEEVAKRIRLESTKTTTPD